MVLFGGECILGQVLLQGLCMSYENYHSISAQHLCNWSICGCSTNRLEVSLTPLLQHKNITETFMVGAPIEVIQF